VICLPAAAAILAAAVFMVLRDDDSVDEPQKGGRAGDQVKDVPTRQEPSTRTKESTGSSSWRRRRWPDRVRVVISETEMVTGSLTKDGTLTVTSRYEIPKIGGSGLRIAAPSEVKKIVWPDHLKPAESDG